MIAKVGRTVCSRSPDAERRPPHIQGDLARPYRIGRVVTTIGSGVRRELIRIVPLLRQPAA